MRFEISESGSSANYKEELSMEAWQGFKGTDWQEKIYVRDFNNQNITVKEGYDSFLAVQT